MKPNLVAKLYAQASDFYETALQRMNSSTLSSAIPKVLLCIFLIVEDWVTTVQVKSIMHNAIAQKFVGQAHGQNDEYGLQVARLQLSSDLLQGANKYIKNASNRIQSDFTTLRTVKNLFFITEFLEGSNKVASKCRV